MLTPQLNPQGYVSSAVNNMTGFANSKFLLVHGTADDNGMVIDLTAGPLLIPCFISSALPKHCYFGRQADKGFYTLL